MRRGGQKQKPGGSGGGGVSGEPLPRAGGGGRVSGSLLSTGLSAVRVAAVDLLLDIMWNWNKVYDRLTTIHTLLTFTDIY